MFDPSNFDRFFLDFGPGEALNPTVYLRQTIGPQYSNVTFCEFLSNPIKVFHKFVVKYFKSNLRLSQPYLEQFGAFVNKIIVFHRNEGHQLERRYSLLT